MKKTYKTFIVLSSLCISLEASSLDRSIDLLKNTNDKLNTYQKQIDKNEEQREELLNEYKYIQASIKSTQTYNQQLQKIKNSQEEELNSLNEQIEDIKETQKNIFPLMLQMISSLENLIKQDTPFLLKERTQRIKRLKTAMDKADIQTHEKYRIILEAFKIEYDYAKTIETYQDKLGNKTYNFLRLGRTALYFQSLDLKEYGYYNKETNSWENISDKLSKSNIRKAIKIANKQQNVDFLNLPFLAKKETND